MKEIELNGIVLLAGSQEQILERLRTESRWGETEELKKLEAREFFVVQGPHFATEAEKYGFSVFSETNAAEKALRALIK